MYTHAMNAGNIVLRSQHIFWFARASTPLVNEVPCTILPNCRAHIWMRTKTDRANVNEEVCDEKILEDIFWTHVVNKSNQTKKLSLKYFHAIISNLFFFYIHVLIIEVIHKL